jgi:two-component system, cell cycle sensor histidine kinase and response regulator CckA
MSNALNQPFSKRLLIGVFILSSLTMIGGGYYYYRKEIRDIQAEKYGELKAISELKISELVAWREERIGDARMATTGVARAELLRWLANPGDLGARSAVRDYAEALASSYGYQNILLVGLDGNILFSRIASLTQLEQTAKDLASRATRERDVVFGDFFRCPICAQVHLDVAAPILDKTERPVAALILRSDPERLIYPLIQSWPTPSKSAETLLIRREGDEVLFLNTLRHSSKPALTVRRSLSNLDLPAASAVSGYIGAKVGRDYRGVEVVADTRPVPGTQWFMVAKVDTDELLAAVTSQGAIVLGFVGLGVVLVGLSLAFWFYATQASLYRDLFNATQIKFLAELKVPDKRAQHAKILMNASAIAVIAIGISVLFGWLLDIPNLKSILPGFVSMKANTALGLTFSGTALVLLAGGSSEATRRFSQGLAVITALLGLATFGEYIFGVNFGIDQILFIEPAGTVGTLAPGRMAPTTAINFIILGIAIGLTGFRRAASTAQRLALVSGLNALLPLVGYFYGTANLYGIGTYTQMAVHTAGAFIILSLGVFLIHPSDGLTKPVLASTLGGWLLRRLLPFMLLSLIFIGWLQVQAERRGYFEGPLGVALLITGLIVLGSATIWWAAGSLTQMDAIRRHAEKRTLDAAEEIRATIYCIGDGVISTDISGRIARINPVAGKLTGWTEAEAVGKSLDEVFQIINEDTQEPVETPVERVLREGHVVGLANHTALISRDGTIRPIVDSGAPIRLLDGQIQGVVLVFRDQVAERAAQVILAQTAANFSAAFHQSPIPMAIRSATTDKFVDVNDIFLRESGYSRDEVLEHTLEDLNFNVNPSDREQISNALRPTGTAYNLEAQFCLKSGDIRIGLISTTTIQLGGKPHFLTSIVDITDRKRSEESIQMGLIETRQHLRIAEDSRRALLSILEDREHEEKRRKELESQLAQAQKMESIGRLAGGVAHDFNNLLGAILGYTEFTLNALPDEDPLKADILEVKKAGDRAVALTRQLLAFSRKQVMQPIPVSLNECIAGLENMLRRILGEDIDIALMLAPDLGVTRVDPGQIEQVLMNLAVNARDAMPDGGKLIIETANVEADEEYVARHVEVNPGLYVQLTVTDTGCGMDNETKAKLFEPFFTTKEKGKGTGLGLSTVYGIVTQSGGNIWVYSELGRGSTFKIYLPLETSVAVERPKVSTVSKRYIGTETVLLVEDEEQLRAVARRSLEAAGYNILEAVNGDEAMRVAAQHAGDIHLLLTDVVMPKMSGRAVAQELSKQRPEIAVLYMSGYTDNAIVHHGVLDAGTHFIAKPFTAKDLRQKVREALDGEDVDPDAWLEEPKNDNQTEVRPLDMKALGALPDGVLGKLRKAVASARYDELVDIIEDIRGMEADVAMSLRRMADCFDYEGIRELLSPRELEEHSDRKLSRQQHSRRRRRS